MYQEIKNTADKNQVTLVAVSKTKPHDAILDIYDQGQRVFGENRVKELEEKHALLPKDIIWHMIGHLQKNKVKYIAAFVDTIHSVDSLSLLEVINQKAKANNRTIKVLLQVKISKEPSKFGFEERDLNEALAANLISNFQNVEIIGLMGMASFVKDEEILSEEFSTLKNLFDQYQSTFFKEQNNFKEISMGMSGDYKLAIEHGSTMIRVGSLIFGSR